MKTVTKVDSIRLAHHFKKDSINLYYVEKPYGEFSDSIVKIEILENDRITGQVEVPYENIDSIINTLTKVKEKFDSNPKTEDLHDELAADVGGGQ